MGKPIVLLVVVLACALGGCGSDDDRPAAGNGPVTSFEQVEGAEGGDSAGVEGVLELKDGCLVVRDDRENEGGVTYPAFAAGTFTWDAESQALTLDGHVVKVGDRVVIGGGAPATPDEVKAPKGCKAAASFFRVAPDGIELAPN